MAILEELGSKEHYLRGIRESLDTAYERNISPENPALIRQIEGCTRLFNYQCTGQQLNEGEYQRGLDLITESIGFLGEESQAGQHQRKRLIALIAMGLRKIPPLKVPNSYEQYTLEAESRNSDLFILV